MTHKRFFALLLVLLLASSSHVYAEQLAWNELNGESYGATVGARAFDEALQALSGSTMGIDLYTDGALGSEMESLQGLQMGTLDIFRGNASTLGNYGAELIAATGLPYLFQSIEDFEAMAVSPLGQELLSSVDASGCGFMALAWLPEGPRSIFITAEAYERLGSPDAITLDMMKGLNLRVPSSNVLHDTIEALGAQPIQVAYSELLPALLSGNIDGAENGVITYIDNGYCEAAPYYIDDAHVFGCGVILVSSAIWDGLTEEQQDWMRQAGEAAREACYLYNLEQEEAYYSQFANKGATKLPVADLEAWQAACSGIYEGQSPAVQDVLRWIRARDY